ncbi:hypothetical protein EB796_023299 [Bugula neritina]|uniref:Uncharacterized protein n=1 Tax=Bugula neritina TaxID=10212 RepID=A0A7J7IYC4_BUGNE|nr:hypothetical protein EB796_023299 [Bugula neritina]
MPPWLRKFAFDYLGRLLRVKETSRAVGSDEFQEFTKLINDAGSPGFEKVESNYEGEREMVEHTDGSIAIRQINASLILLHMKAFSQHQYSKVMLDFKLILWMNKGIDLMKV